MKNWVFILFLLFGITKNTNAADYVFQKIEKESVSFITSSSDYGYLGSATRNEHSNVTTPFLKNRVSSKQLKQLNFDFYFDVPLSNFHIYLSSVRKPFICAEIHKNTTSSSLYKLFNNYRL